MVKKKSIKKTAKKKTAKKPVKKAIKTSKPKKRIIKKEKTVIKKKATKKTIKKKTLVVAVGDRCFWINYGPAVRDLLELRNVLEILNKEQFKHHVNNTRNDFSEWIRDVLQDKKTADAVKKVKTPRDMIKIVEKALKEYHI